ncbi:hypothetical protein GUITHDRAFT_116932 [Guillardia theta CCMP2712]|uniref:Uncharacterized protein n=1 Tax=Guillardia theta (strain CCMP2712) TaxID=905079 RepID=L1IM91_GUITC|nr:hypothetical protein GUITHDRAFT_116932 [Guillardia theta CCMP2712]EKX36910.1 hypothetical protein GUITHDRAFT_116932 [Guillardia theta CCMP2712]|eukprot:XP_005823890.1 hypothetical protein GUITHDRAFT_116932 [Guillardia theta CCMP2712]
MGALTNQAHLFYSTYIFVCLMYPNAASEHGRVRLSLRGGQDPQLIAEALSDLKRMRRGKLPLFLEKVMDGYDDDRTCSDANFEARPPPTFGLSTASSKQRFEQKQELDPELTQEEEDRLDRERAKKYFQELDAKYFYPHENVSHMYHPEIPQRRSFPEDPLERYKECRRIAQQIRQYLKNLPPAPKPDTPEYQEWLNKHKFEKIIDRDGNILRFQDLPRNETLADEFEVVLNSLTEDPNESPDDDDELDSDEAKREIYTKEWLDAYTVMHDLDLADSRYYIEDLIEGDEHKIHVYEEFQDYGMQKWLEFRDGPRYHDEMAEIMSNLEKVVKDRGLTSKSYNVPRERDLIIDVGSSETEDDEQSS